MFRDKVTIIDNLKVNDKLANGYTVKHLTRSDSIIPKLGNALSLESYQDIRKHSVSYSGYSNAECLEFVERKSNFTNFNEENESVSGYDEVMSQFQPDNVLKFEEMEQLKLKLTALESRNSLLMQQMESVSNKQPKYK